METTRKRTVVQGIEHGLSGYTNYGCRCKVCTEANREHSRQYRARRFAGEPLCIIEDCPDHQSPSYGNGLCYRHAMGYLGFSEGLDELSRLELKRIIRRYDLEISVLKRHTDDDLREMIRYHMGPANMAKAA